jgi:hypothetical protein
MSTFATPNIQSFNFGFKIKGSTSEGQKKKTSSKKGNLVRENRKTQELARKRQMISEKAKETSTLPLTFSMQTLPL